MLIIVLAFPRFFVSGTKLSEFEVTEKNRYENIHDKLVAIQEKRAIAALEKMEQQIRFNAAKANIEANIEEFLDLPKSTDSWTKTQMIASINDSIEDLLEGNFDTSEILFAGAEPWEQVFDFPIEGQLFSDSTKVKNISQMGWRKNHPTLHRGAWHYGCDISIASVEGIIKAMTDIVILSADHTGDGGYTLEYYPVGYPNYIVKDIHLQGKVRNSKGRLVADSLWEKLDVGDTIPAGSDLATIGSSGKRCIGRHLHRELIVDGKKVDMKNMYNWETLEPIADKFVLRKAKGKPWYEAIPVYDAIPTEYELPEDDLAMSYKAYMPFS